MHINYAVLIQNVWNNTQCFKCNCTYYFLSVCHILKHYNMVIKWYTYLAHWYFVELLSTLQISQITHCWQKKKTYTIEHDITFGCNYWPILVLSLHNILYLLLIFIEPGKVTTHTVLVYEKYYIFKFLIHISWNL